MVTVCTIVLYINLIIIHQGIIARNKKLSLRVRVNPKERVTHNLHIKSRVLRSEISRVTFTGVFFTVCAALVKPSVSGVHQKFLTVLG